MDAKKAFRGIRDDFLLLEHKMANFRERQEEQAVVPQPIHNRSLSTASERPPNSPRNGSPDLSHAPNHSAVEHYDDIREGPVPASMQIEVAQESEASFGQHPAATQQRHEISATVRPSNLAHAAASGVKRPHGLISQDVVAESLAEPASIQRPPPRPVERRTQQNPMAAERPQQSQHVKVESMPAQPPL